MTEAEFHAATDAEMRELSLLLRTHTALGRISGDELLAALNYARANGFTIYKHDEAAE